MQLEGFINECQGKKFCFLKGSIYGLKQASRLWNIRFGQAIKSYGYDQCVEESCVYKKFENDKRVFLMIYIVDIVLVCHTV